MIETNKTRYNRENNQIRHYAPPKADYKPLQQTSALWKDRQLQDYHKANGMCFYCGEKFVPGHIEVCSKRQKPQVNAIVLNDLDRELSDDVLNDIWAFVLLDHIPKHSPTIALETNCNTLGVWLPHLHLHFMNMSIIHPFMSLYA